MSSIKEFEHLRMQLEDVISATNNFSTSNYIGKGGFGMVYKGELSHSEGITTVAVKRLDRAFGQGNPEFWKEIMMLSCYKHENLISLLGFCDENNEKILVYEYTVRGSLDFYLSRADLTWSQRLKICIGAARGLEFLHNPQGTQQRVIHRDIKSSNILLDENWNAKISDFGLSKLSPANQQFTFLISNVAGTFGYCNPLYMETGFLTKESDVYSFGVVLFEVLCGRLYIGNYEERRPLTGLVRQRYEQNTLQEIVFVSLKDQMKMDSSKAFTKIAYQCLKREREDRPTMVEILKQLELALEYQISEEIAPRCSSFENPLAGLGPASSSLDSHDEDRSSTGNVNIQFGTAIYDFTAGSDINELNLIAGEELEIEYEVDGWFYVKKKRPGPDGKMEGLVPVLYVSLS